jgi:hypothetical protein
VSNSELLQLCARSTPHPSSLQVEMLPDAAFWSSSPQNIRNAHTRRAYAQAVREFLVWCETAGVSSIGALQPIHVASYVEQLALSRTASTAKSALLLFGTSSTGWWSVKCSP